MPPGVVIGTDGSVAVGNRTQMPTQVTVPEQLLETWPVLLPDLTAALLAKDTRNVPRPHPPDSAG